MEVDENVKKKNFAKIITLQEGSQKPILPKKAKNMRDLHIIRKELISSKR